MSYYETIFIVRQDLSEKQVETLTGDLGKILAENGAKIARTEQWGLRTLAYRIRKNRKGHYVLLHIDGPHTAVAEMERQMRLNEDIMRYMTVRLDAIPTEPSVMMRKNDYDTRGEAA
ncbi:MAG: 30S ribosomal protein S6 [Micavibrio sp.]|jgi:small subunit ribosomal protein S6|nr:MAG: 30S ribosomal protein S6 [Micavibrio sp.]